MEGRIDMNTKLFVGNLSLNTMEEDLRWLFSKTGHVVSIDLIKDKATRQPKGFAFVEMISVGDAGKAVSEYNGYELNDRKIRVSPAKPNENKTQWRRKQGYVEYESYNKSIRK
jgi:RNA recognition motif-containing protein